MYQEALQNFQLMSSLVLDPPAKLSQILELAPQLNKQTDNFNEQVEVGVKRGFALSLERTGQFRDSQTASTDA